MLGFARKLVKQAEGIIAPDIETNSPSYGFRIVHIDFDSEAFHAGLQPLFDFIYAVNGVRFDRRYFGPGSNGGGISVEQEQSPSAEFERVVASTEERLVLEVWCAKGRSTRILTLPNPSKQANGLGLYVKWCPLNVADHVWHILNVLPHSPADQAGLISHADYIVAAENGALDEGGEYLLGRVINQTPQREGVLFYVYNRDYDIVRPVRVFPSDDRKLGCGVGYGLLHALPKVNKTSAQSGHAPGAMVFDEDQHSQSPAATFAAPPANNIAPSPAIQYAPQASRMRHHRGTSQQGGGDLLNDYFEEQTKISRELDSVPKAKSSGIPPPPQKAD